MSAKAPALAAKVPSSVASDGSRARDTVSAAATFIAVGNTSLDDWPRLTSSFGCTSRPSPRAPPSSSEARLASTSLTFMLVWVPEPVCHTARDIDARGAALDDQERADQRGGHFFVRDMKMLV